MNTSFFQPVILIVSATVLAGCATAPMTMNEQDTSSLHESKLTVIHYEPDPFLPMTNTKGAFAVLGVAAAVSEGSELVREHNLEDPAIDIKTSLANDLSDTYQISDVKILQEAKPYESNPEEVAALASHDGIVLDVRTFGWGTMYYPFKTKYKVNYMAQARLINAREKRLISAERCTINEEYSENSPTYDELMENGAALLKKKLADASTECAARFAKKMGVNHSVALKQ
ncbi:hypothetical protein ACFL3A_00765 [Pseudomonadota bacterium]